MRCFALAGNDRLKEQLSQQEGGRGLAHAYIISGPVGTGRHTLARLLAAAMVCTAGKKDRPCGVCGACKKIAGGIHPDVKIISGQEEGKPITVDQIRTLRADAYIRPNEGERKVYLLERGDQMNSSAQNAMLKLLEEGPQYAAFLLLAENAGGLLQTVRSRCEMLTLSPLSPGQCEEWLKDRFPEKSQEEIRTAALDCQGILGRAVEYLEGTEEKGHGRTQAEQLARAMEQGSELQLFEAAMVLDKMNREELNRLLSRLEEALGKEIKEGGDLKRLLRGTELVRQLRRASQLNANSGQLAGWLCAGMFTEK